MVEFQKIFYAELLGHLQVLPIQERNVIRILRMHGMKFFYCSSNANVWDEVSLDLVMTRVYLNVVSNLGEFDFFHTPS